MAYNPPLMLAARVALRHVGPLEVRRKPENGGDRDYAAAAELAADYASGALHPGDLKPAVLAAVVKVLERVQDAFKTDKDAKQADAALKAFIKKSAKQK